MPSWNIHTAHVEKLFEDCVPADLGIEDANVFLFGNYVPDIYLGFMIAEPTYHIDYCLTHMADPHVTPVPDADRFWDRYVVRRKLAPANLSLALGAWAHLMADRMYNSRFRQFVETHDTPEGDELRIRKQADFDAFGCSLALSSHVRIDDDLVEAAGRFRPYSVLREDVVRTVEVASAIVCANAESSVEPSYCMLDSEWMADTFDACDERLRTWLETWQDLEARGCGVNAADIRAMLE